MSNIFGEGSFDDGKEESRFQALLDSETQLGDDLQNIFDQLKLEVHGGSYEEELSENIPFALGPVGVGIIKGHVCISYAGLNTI